MHFPKEVERDDRRETQSMMRSGISRYLAAAAAAAKGTRTVSAAATGKVSRLSPWSPASSGAVFSAPSSSAEVVDEEFVLGKRTAVPKVATEPILLQPRVVIYDGVCHLCHRGVKWIIQKDKYEKIKFCCLQSKAAEPYLRFCGVDREDVLRRFLFIEGPEAYYQGSAAALKVASYLPLPYSVLSTLLIIPAPLRDAVYDFVASRRYDWFGKAEKCIVMQEKEMLERFIDRDEMFGDGDDIGRSV